MRRGDIVLVALPGDYGKPRPAIVVQSDLLNGEDPDSYLVCPLTTSLRGQGDVRVRIEPAPGNGLTAPSDAMVDKTSPAPRRHLRDIVGRLDTGTMRAVDPALLVVFGLA